MADYATLAEVKQRIDKNDTDADTYLPTIISGASRAIDNFCNRPDGFVALSVATSRLYSGQGRATLRIDENIEVTLVEVKASVTSSAYTAWAATDWLAFSGDARFPNFNGLPYDHLMVDVNGNYSVFISGRLGGRSYKDSFFRDGNYDISAKYNYNPRNARSQPTVRVTAKWGYAAVVPAAIKEACCMQVARWYKRYESSMSDVLASGELGQLFYRQTLDPDVAMILVEGRYVRPTIGRR